MRILAIIAILMLAPTTAMARGGGGGHSPSVHASANVTGIASGKRPDICFSVARSMRSYASISLAIMSVRVAPCPDET